MGKDSLIKSTTKKSGSKKEKKPSKKKNAAKAVETQKEAPAKARNAKKNEPALTIQELLFKQFSNPRPPEDSQPAAPDLSGMTAPPFFTSTDPKEVARLDALLGKHFSMAEISAAAREPAPVTPAPPPKQPLSREELLLKKFASQPLNDTPLPARDLSDFTSPALIASADPQEVERLQALLEKRFSMEEIIAAAREPVTEAPPQRQELEPVKPTLPVEEPVPVEPAPSAQTASTPEPVQEPVPAQPPEAPTIETPAPATPPAEVATAVMPAAQAPAADATPLEAPKAAPEPVAPAKQAGIALPPKEERQSQPPPTQPEPKAADPAWRNFKIGLATVAAVFLLILLGSLNNSGKYFVMPKKGSIEIWKGNFSPTGKQFVAVLHGVEPAATVKESYSREEISPILFNYYIGKADALLDVSGLPDYKSISDYLKRAREYAVTDESLTAVQTRMDNIQRLSLMYKAEIDISKGTVASLQEAVQTLKEVQRLTTEPNQLEALNKKIETVNASLSALNAKATGAPSEQNHAAPEK